MRKKITYLNCVLTVIAVALTVLILQNAKIIQPVEAAQPQRAVDVNISEVGGRYVFGSVPITSTEAIPVRITAEKQW